MVRARARLARLAALTLAPLLASCAGCKDAQQSSRPPVAAPPAPASDAASPRPAAVPTTTAEPDVPPPITTPITIDEARGALPALDGKEILALKQTSDQRQVHGTWCLDGDSADDVARKVGRAMGDAGYTGMAVRGDARKAGVQGERDGFRLSMVVSASTAATCPAPKHYFASATIYKQ